MPSDYEAALAWQIEQNLACGGCGVPRDQAWVMGLDRDSERALHAEARESVARKLCAYCKASEDDKAKARNNASEAKQPEALHGVHWVFEQ